MTEEIVIPEERTEERPAPAVPQPQTPQNEAEGQVWHSKYTRRAAASRAQGEIGATGTIYRKKRNTVEFTPGQKVAAAPPAPQPEPKAGEPVGEPLHLPQAGPPQRVYDGPGRTGRRPGGQHAGIYAGV